MIMIYLTISNIISTNEPVSKDTFHGNFLIWIKNFLFYSVNTENYILLFLGELNSIITKDSKTKENKHWSVCIQFEVKQVSYYN